MATLAVAALFVRLPYDLVSPGRTPRLGELVAVKGAPVFPLRGRFLYPTVALRERANPYEALAGWLDPTVAVTPDRRVRGTLPPGQFDQLNQELMSESKRAAEVVVLRRLGYQVAQGAVIEATDPKFPGVSALRQDDLVTSVDGQVVSLAEDLAVAIRARRPGDRVKLQVVRSGGPPREVEAQLAGSPGRTVLGVRLSSKVKLPFEIAIDSGDVGGPSAGLAYALQLQGMLTPDDLTGGKIVAATGEIGFQGQVRPIGGVTQKTIGVRRAGTDVFLVPRENFAEAHAHAGKHLQVVAVDNFEDAIRELKRRNPGKSRAG